MIKHEYKTLTYTKTEEVMISEKRYCDCCGKEITGAHWSVATGHNDWGNDSCESIEHKDACSTTCLYSMFKEYSEVSNGDWNSEYMTIEHHAWADVKGDIKYDQT